MRMLVLVPTDSYLQNAGARIRYGRLIAPLKDHGVQLEMLEIGQFDPASTDADVLLISKCHDARAHLVAIGAQRRGIQVGVDLFDDYFSQYHDARLTRFRHWLSTLSPWLSYILTSTEVMAGVARSFAQKLPIQVINDAAARQGNTIQLAGANAIEAKLQRTIDSQRLLLGWFGIGDSPYFPVGLSDIAAHASELTSLARLTNMAVELTVLTNARALTAQGLAQLSALPIKTIVQTWSEKAEGHLLERSFACFLPVNAQPFSAAKSLNRAITALASGSQLLSIGYPLYAQLDPFIYRGADELAADVGRRSMRVSADRRDDLIGVLDERASANAEAQKLAALLKAIPSRTRSTPGTFALIHGANTNMATHKLARAMGALTVTSPYAPANIDADKTVSVSIPLRVEIEPVERSAVRTKMRSKRLASGAERFDSGNSLVKIEKGRSVDLSRSPLGVQLALYRPVMDILSVRLGEVLGVDQVSLSENSPIPYLARSDGGNL